jgi:pSer/pThr/pTyr-binding forkhead associated (FHA) protein
MQERQFIRVGRGHDADIRVTDISVSRFHAKINRSEDGSFYVEDNKSKFGTLL